MQDGEMTPKSTKITQKDKHIKLLKEHSVEIEGCKAFVLGISGGDCAGKRELVQYMFDSSSDEWRIKETNEPVALLRQEYFIKEEGGKRFTSGGTDWEYFAKTALHLKIGNDVTVNYMKNGVPVTLSIKSAKLLVIQGSHIFMSNHQLSKMINLSIFIDSDSDVRLSRRIFKDTEELRLGLQQSISQYLEFIKPSYEKDIEPSKKESDIIIPHFGGGFKDHHSKNKQDHSSNIKNACSLILAHLKEQMKDYEEEIEDTV